MEQGLGNPAAVATIASSKEGQAAIGQALTATKVLLIVGGSAVALKYGYAQYKKWRAEQYAQKNAGDPNLIAAAIIYESFTRVGFPSTSILSFLIPELNISTNESALNEIASKITNVKAVSDAYNILFNRTLHFDIQKGLDTTELQTFWQIINAPSSNTDVTTAYPIGSTLYVAEKNGIIVNTAEKNEKNEWFGTNNLFAQLDFNAKIGVVVDKGVFENQNYYIVEEPGIFGGKCYVGCKTGVVLQYQVTNKKL